MTGAPRDPWLPLGARTPARIALGRVGASLPTREVMSFALAHAQARDAVHARLDGGAIASRIAAAGLVVIEAATPARDRAVYLRRPDLGRILDDASSARVRRAVVADGCDLAIVIGDGLSAKAAAHAPAVIEALQEQMARLGIRIGPVVVAEGARVALGDEVGALLGARLVVVLIGERPGLSACDSLSAYLTFAPRIGRTDAERNCISNIRPGGLVPVAAAAKLAWLIEASFAMKLSGVRLKDHSDTAPIQSGDDEALLSLPRNQPP